MPNVYKVRESWGIVKEGVGKGKVWGELGKVMHVVSGGFAQVIHRGVNKF